MFGVLIIVRVYLEQSLPECLECYMQVPVVVVVHYMIVLNESTSGESTVNDMMFQCFISLE